MKFPPITTARLEYRSFLRSSAPSCVRLPSFALFSFFSLTFPFELRSSIVYHPHTRSRMNGHVQADQRQTNRNVFESIQSASYFAPHRIAGSSKDARVLRFKKRFRLKVFEYDDDRRSRKYYALVRRYDIT